MAEIFTGNTAIGTIEKVPLKKRQRAAYWRAVLDKKGNQVLDENGHPLWAQTRMLPSDMAGKELYLGKGFRLRPPGEDTMAGTRETDVEVENRVLRAKIAEIDEAAQAKMAELSRSFEERLALLEARLMEPRVDRKPRKKSSGEGRLSGKAEGKLP